MKTRETAKKEKEFSGIMLKQFPKLVISSLLTANPLKELRWDIP